MLKVKLLGHFELWRDGELVPAEAWPQRKAQAVLKLLLAQRGQLITQDQLIERFFSHLEPDQAVRSLQSRISEARRLIEPHRHNGKGFQYILRKGQGYCFNKAATCQIDAEVFESTIQAALKAQESGLWDQATDHYRQAVALYDGGFLAEDRYEEWTLQIREHYLQLYLTALERLAICHASVQHYRAAIECCDKVIEMTPRESVYRQKMLYHSHANERELALQTYQACVQRLKSELDVEPSLEIQALCQQILKGEGPKPVKVIAHNLPVQGTSFIGREQELSEIEELLGNSQCRVLSLVGLGGIGKTRLALEAAGKQVAKQRFQDGVYFVTLAGVSSPDLLANTVADALRLSFFGQEAPEEQLLNYLREKEMLLLLDNFEHLRWKATYLSRVVQKSPKVKLLITSRERLNLQEEWPLEIKGLEVPGEDEGGRLEAHASTRLFVERAKQMGLKTISPKEKPLVAKICRLVQGMPLGIEMTAAWTRVMSCQQIADGIVKGLDLLATPSVNLPQRHRNIRAVFEHSWRLLSQEEQDVFRRLSIFRGGFQLEAATYVAGLTLPLLTSFLDKCLVSRSLTGRCELHELLRQFAEEKLKGDEDAFQKTRDLYCEYFAKFLHQREAALNGPDQKQTVQEIEKEIENVRASWNLSVQEESVEVIAKSLESFHLFFDLRGRFQEGEQTSDNAVNAFRNRKPLNTALIGKLLSKQGYFLMRLGSYEKGLKLLKECLKYLESHSDYRGEAEALRRVGHIHRLQGEYLKAKQCYLRSMHLFEKVNYPIGLVSTKNGLAAVIMNLGEPSKSRKLLQECLALSEKCSFQEGIAVCLNNLGEVARLTGEYTRARRLYQESMKVEELRDNQWGMAISLKNLALTAKYLGEYKKAHQLYQEALSIEKPLGDQWASARTYQQMGEVACCLKEYKRAYELLQKSLKISKEIKDQWTKALVLISLGQLAYQQRQFSQAKHKFEESLVICRRIDRPVGIINSLAGLGAVATEHKEYQQAKKSLHEGLNLAMKKQATPLVSEVLGEIGGLFIRVGDKELAEEILEFVFLHKASEKRVKDQAKQLLLAINPTFSRGKARKTAKGRKAKTLGIIASQVLKRLESVFKVGDERGVGCVEYRV